MRKFLALALVLSSMAATYLFINSEHSGTSDAGEAPQNQNRSSEVARTTEANKPTSKTDKTEWTATETSSYEARVPSSQERPDSARINISTLSTAEQEQFLEKEDAVDIKTAIHSGAELAKFPLVFQKFRGRYSGTIEPAPNADPLIRPESKKRATFVLGGSHSNGEIRGRYELIYVDVETGLKGTASGSGSLIDLHTDEHAPAKNIILTTGGKTPEAFKLYLSEDGNLILGGQFALNSESRYVRVGNVVLSRVK